MTNKFRLLILAGVHGQEPQSSFVLKEIMSDFIFKQSIPFHAFERDKDQLHIVAIPEFNIYGLKNHTRGNKNAVDLNRNLPAKNWSKEFSHEDYFSGSKPASETETQKLVEIIDDFKPDLIISIHTNHFVTNSHPPQVNFDGNLNTKGHKLALKLSELIDLEFTCDIGYSTPGSLGSYAKDLNIPCITLEFDDDLDNQASFDKYSKALLEFFNFLDLDRL